jgi:hypothetical protein
LRMLVSVVGQPEGVIARDRQIMPIGIFIWTALV